MKNLTQILHWIAELQIFGASGSISDEDRQLFTNPKTDWVSYIHIEEVGQELAGIIRKYEISVHP